VECANDSKYGLGAGIWTQNLSRAHQVAAQIQSGLVWVNTHHRNDPSSPWGGMKESGIGRENGVEAFEACKSVPEPVDWKLLVIWFTGSRAPHRFAEQINYCEHRANQGDS
jgi:acyl-CoA reductase-like NAD-dependent aldehyde dehydrogenase